MDTKALAPLLSDWDRECMAWHEAGHAVCAMCIPGCEPIERLSIVPDDESFGFMRMSHSPHNNSTSISMSARISVELGGPLSERLFLRRMTTSCGSDFQAAYHMAKDMVLRFGMGRRIGVACPGCSSEDELRDFENRNGRAVEKDVRDIVMKASRHARLALLTHRHRVRAVAGLLLRKGTLDKADLDGIG